MPSDQTISCNTGQSSTERDALIGLVNDLVDAMRYDYADRFRFDFDTDEKVRGFKNRLYTKLKPYSCAAITDGYEQYLNDHPDRFPPIQVLSAYVQHEQTKAKRAEEEQRQIEHHESLPPPSRNVDPRQLLAGLKINRKLKPEPDGQEQDNGKKLADLLAKHEVLIAQHKREHKIRPSVTTGSLEAHKCCFGACQRPGTLSQSTVGDSKFYCREHFRQWI